jgi:hypothetical protein
VREAIAGRSTGRRFVANALAAYWLFQGWGNDPDGSDETLKRTVAGPWIFGRNVLLDAGIIDRVDVDQKRST